MNKNVKNAVKKLVNRFVADIMSLVKSGSSASGPKAKRPKAAPAAPRGRKAKRAPARGGATKHKRKAPAKRGETKQVHRDAGIMQSLRRRALDAVRAADPMIGISAGQIAHAIRAESSDLAFPLDTLRAKGLLEMVGLRSKARWFVTEAGREISAPALSLLFERGKRSAARSPNASPVSGAAEPSAEVPAPEPPSDLAAEPVTEFVGSPDA
jgi:hypothetical protein